MLLLCLQVVVILNDKLEADHFLLIYVWVATSEVLLRFQASDDQFHHTVSTVGYEVDLLYGEVYRVTCRYFESIICASY